MPQFVMLRAEREVRRGLQTKSEWDARSSTSARVAVQLQLRPARDDHYRPQIVFACPR